MVNVVLKIQIYKTLISDGFYYFRKERSGKNVMPTFFQSQCAGESVPLDVRLL